MLETNTSSHVTAERAAQAAHEARGAIRKAASATAAANNAADSATSMGLILALLVERLRQEIADLKMQALCDRGGLKGHEARIAGFIAAHPDSPERKMTSRHSKNSKPMSVSKTRWIDAFDAHLRHNGIADPEKHRH